MADQPNILARKGTIINSSVTVGTSSVEIVTEKTTYQRIELIITNTSTLNQVITLGIGQEAVAGSGIPLAAGSSYVSSIDPKYSPPNERITAVASAPSGSVAVFERGDPYV